MKKGFTLLELLIVIGILAILAAVVTVVLNPAQLLAQARDAQRVSDVASLNSALGMYVVDVAPIALGSDTLCYTHNTGVTAVGCAGADGAARHGTKTASSITSRSVSGTGWVPVDFTDISGGSPLPTLPQDPTNDTTYFYSYAASTTAATFEINANLESTKYSPLETNAKDGGNVNTIYEIGTALDL
jgi:prepilin-type N-terminal cleavage/methylation domain-containing protein